MYSITEAFHDLNAKSKELLRENFEFVAQKSVPDSDGFLTDYTLYKDRAQDLWITIFGDSDLYTPENAEPDQEFESEEIAREWFDSYQGFDETDDHYKFDDIDEAYQPKNESVAPSSYNPQKTGKGYKVFRVKDGKLYPPMVANPGNIDTPVGIWLTADIGEAAPNSKTGRPQVKSSQGGSLAFRPGWHLGELPRAPQFDRTNPETGNKELFPADFVWAECEYTSDIDYQDQADERGYIRTNPDGTERRSDKYQHSLAGMKEIPVDGSYRYRTNPNPDTIPWIITGAIKVNKLLDDAEVNQILRDHGMAEVHRQGGDKTLEDLGLTQITEAFMGLYEESSPEDADQNPADTDIPETDDSDTPETLAYDQVRKIRRKIPQLFKLIEDELDLHPELNGSLSEETKMHDKQICQQYHIRRAVLDAPFKNHLVALLHDSGAIQEIILPEYQKFTQNLKREAYATNHPVRTVLKKLKDYINSIKSNPFSVMSETVYHCLQEKYKDSDDQDFVNQVSYRDISFAIGTICNGQQRNVHEGVTIAALLGALASLVPMLTNFGAIVGLVLAVYMLGDAKADAKKLRASLYHGYASKRKQTRAKEEEDDR